jgi:hypothetical protein
MEIKTLLADGKTNAKTKKNLRPTGILYLHPSVIEGKDMCPFATKNCRMACLNTAGRGAFSNIQQSRINKTKYYVLERETFLSQLSLEINKMAKKYSSETLAIRLNGTSDQPLVESILKDYTIADNVVFYDYTKNHKKVGTRTFPSGHKYVVTYSLHEHNLESFSYMLDNKLCIGAAVFNIKPGQPMITEWNGFPVVDGDERDDLMLDVPNGTILGLRAKGKARQDTSGFVIHIN